MSDKPLSSYMKGSIPSQYVDPKSSDPFDPHGLASIPGNPDHPQTTKLFPSKEEKIIMAEKINAIFQIHEADANQNVDMVEEVVGDEDAEPIVDLEDQRRKTESLKGVLSTLAQLWWADSDEMDDVTEKLADGSRDPTWRIPLGDSGVLNFFLEIFSTHILRPNLKIHILRLVGNSCADTDENRARVVASSYLPSIIIQLKDASLIPFAIPVLYNICLDYEPAQQQASASYLTSELMELVSSPHFNDSSAFLGYVCKILDLMITQPAEVELAPEYTARILLKIAADRENPVDLEDFILVVNTAVSYLKYEKFQKALMAPGAMDQTLAVMVDSYTRFDSHSPHGASSPPDDLDAKALQDMRTNFNQVLSDVSALPEFQETYPVTSTLTSSLRRWLLSPQSQLQVCACIMLGNLARSDSACEEFVHTSRVHLPLISILTVASESSLLHAALGFLKNLALPAKNKDILGASGLIDVLPRLWALDTLQQIQFTSISLARQLTIGNYDNVRLVCKRISNDPDSPAYSRTNLSLLIALFERTDVEPIKMEIARLITSICRVFTSTAAGGRSPAELEAVRTSFFERHPDVGRPLSFMVSQTKWPVVRSEGWFVFALMARFPEGAKCIGDLLHDVAVFRPLVEMLTGKDLIDNEASSWSPSTLSLPVSSMSSSPSPVSLLSPTPASVLGLTPENPEPHAQATEMARIDRENALVLVSEMLKNRGSEMALMRRTLYEDLLKGGSEIVLSYREARPARESVTLAEATKVGAQMDLRDSIEQSVVEFS